MSMATDQRGRAQGGTSVAEQQTNAFTTTPTKADLIEGINGAWSNLERTIAGSDEEALTTPGGDRWSVKDHLAHIESWERYLLALLERRSPSILTPTARPRTTHSTNCSSSRRKCNLSPRCWPICGARTSNSSPSLP